MFYYIAFKLHLSFLTGCHFPKSLMFAVIMYCLRLTLTFFGGNLFVIVVIILPNKIILKDTWACLAMHFYYDYYCCSQFHCALSLMWFCSPINCSTSLVEMGGGFIRQSMPRLFCFPSLVMCFLQSSSAF